MALSRIEIRTSSPQASGADNYEMSGVEDGLVEAIRRAQAGDARGFETLFHALGASVAGYLRAHRVSDPDGLANEVFLRAFRTIHTFGGDGNRFRSWIFTIAHHAAVDDSRRRRRVSEAPLARAPETPGGDVETEVLANLAHDRVQGLLSKLSPDQRDVLLLRVVADRSVSETAAVLGKSHEAVKALQHRALATLHRALSSDDSSDDAVSR